MLKFFNKVKESLFKNLRKENLQTSLHINNLEEFLNKTSSEIQIILDEDINRRYTVIIDEIRLAKEMLSNLKILFHQGKKDCFMCLERL